MKIDKWTKGFLTGMLSCIAIAVVITNSIIYTMPTGDIPEYTDSELLSSSSENIKYALNDMRNPEPEIQIYVTVEKYVWEGLKHTHENFTSSYTLIMNLLNETLMDIDLLGYEWYREQPYGVRLELAGRWFTFFTDCLIDLHFLSNRTWSNLSEICDNTKNINLDFGNATYYYWNLKCKELLIDTVNNLKYDIDFLYMDAYDEWTEMLKKPYNYR